MTFPRFLQGFFKAFPRFFQTRFKAFPGHEQWFLLCLSCAFTWLDMSWLGHGMTWILTSHDVVMIWHDLSRHVMSCHIHVVACHVLSSLTSRATHVSCFASHLLSSLANEGHGHCFSPCMVVACHLHGLTVCCSACHLIAVWRSPSSCQCRHCCHTMWHLYVRGNALFCSSWCWHACEVHDYRWGGDPLTHTTENNLHEQIRRYEF